MITSHFNFLEYIKIIVTALGEACLLWSGRKSDSASRPIRVRLANGAFPIGKHLSVASWSSYP